MVDGWMNGWKDGWMVDRWKKKYKIRPRGVNIDKTLNIRVHNVLVFEW